MMLSWLSGKVIHQLWDLKDRSIKLKVLKELEKSQWQTEQELRERQFRNVKDMAQYAYSNCEYYRFKFDEHNIRPSAIKNISDVQRIPILSKKDIASNTSGLIAKCYKEYDLVAAKTGGSTGKALRIFFDIRCQDMRNAAAMRSDRWAGWEIGMRRAAIWGNPPVADTLKKKIRNILLDRVIYLDTMSLSEESMSDFVAACRKFKPAIIFGHSHSIYMFAKFLQDKKIMDIAPKGIISTSMMLMPHERQAIENVFNCKVTDRYGCEEVGLIACECEMHDGMHLNVDHLYIEFIKDDGSPAKAGEEGTIVVTDLINKGMPLIRYRVEDVGVPTDRKCLCGRGLPLMERVAGRVADFLARKDGSLVAGVSLIERTLTAVEGIEQMQIVQDDIHSIRLNVVPDKNYSETSRKMLVDEIAKVFGKDINTKVSVVGQIPQEESGKYRFSICNVGTPS